MVITVRKCGALVMPASSLALHAVPLKITANLDRGEVVVGVRNGI